MKYTVIYATNGMFTVHASNIREATELAEKKKPLNSKVVEIIGQRGDPPKKFDPLGGIK